MSYALFHSTICIRHRTVPCPNCNLAARAISTIVSEWLTCKILNGDVTSEDRINIAINTIFDVSFSTITYYYNPMSDLLSETIVDTTVDSIIDYAETKIIFSQNFKETERNRIDKLTFMERRLTT